MLITNPGIGEKPMPGGSDIFEDIVEKLDRNGETTDQEFRQDMIHLMAELGRRTKPIEKLVRKVDRLEKNSLLLIAKKYPKTSLSIIGIWIIFTLTVIVRLGLLPWLSELIRIPLP